MKTKKAMFLTGTFLVLFLVSGAARAFALPISVGGGVTVGGESINLDWPTGSLSGPGPILWAEDNRLTIRQNSVGASVFFDAHFVNLSVDFLQGNFDVSGRMPNATPGNVPADMFVGSWSATLINFNLVGKFPIPLFNMHTVRIFPMLGAGYQVGSVVENLGDGGLFDRGFNNIRILFGIGADFDLNNRVFIRLSLLPYYHLTRRVTLALVDPTSPPDQTPFVAHGGFGTNATLAFGFRLGSNPQPMPQPRNRGQAPQNIEPQVTAEPQVIAELPPNPEPQESVE